MIHSSINQAIVFLTENSYLVAVKKYYCIFSFFKCS